MHAVSVSHFSLCVWIPLGTGNIHLGETVWRPPVHPLPSHQQPHSAAGKSGLFMDLQATTLLFYKTKIHSPLKLPFAPTRTRCLSEVLSCDSKQEDATIGKHMLNDTTTPLLGFSSSAEGRTKTQVVPGRQEERWAATQSFTIMARVIKGHRGRKSHTSQIHSLRQRKGRFIKQKPSPRCYYSQAKRK